MIKKMSMEQINLDISRVYDYVSAEDIKGLAGETSAAQKILYNGDGDGNDFLGWLHLPSEITENQIKDIEDWVEETNQELINERVIATILLDIFDNRMNCSIE